MYTLVLDLNIPFQNNVMSIVLIHFSFEFDCQNWGLVTYREVDLLIDPTKASNSQKQRVCSVVTHELAHQWFGNLVTMEWWEGELFSFLKKIRQSYRMEYRFQFDLSYLAYIYRF